MLGMGMYRRIAWRDDARAFARLPHYASGATRVPGRRRAEGGDDAAAVYAARHTNTTSSPRRSDAAACPRVFYRTYGSVERLLRVASRHCFAPPVR